MLAKRISKIAIALMATLVGLYPFIYFLIDRKFGLLQSKNDALLSNILWNTGFYTHITLGGLALLIGWTQFVVKLRTKSILLHRNIGKVYIISSLLSAVAGLYIALFATGGMIASLGFICLGVIWVYSTLRAYIEIKQGRVDKHQQMMIYSYAACFSAVTLRIYLPILILSFQDFMKAYLIVAWLCWMPNIIVAYLLARRLHTRKANASVNSRTAN